MLLSAGPAPLILVLCYSSIRVPATQLNPHTTGSLRPWAAPFPFSWWAVPMARHRNLGLQIFVYGPQSPETTPKQSGVDLYPLQFVRMFQSIRCSIASIRTCVLSQGIVRKNNYRNSLNTNTEVTFIIGCLILPVHHQNVRHHLCPRTPVGKLVCGGGSPPEQEPTGGLRKGPPEHHQSWWKCFSFGIGLRDTLSYPDIPRDTQRYPGSAAMPGEEEGHVSKQTGHLGTEGAGLSSSAPATRGDPS